MDIFVIRIEDANNVNEDLLKEFQKKEISNENKRKTHCFSYLMTDRILREVYKIEDREIVFENKPQIVNKVISTLYINNFLFLLVISKKNTSTNTKNIASFNINKHASTIK